MIRYTINTFLVSYELHSIKNKKKKKCNGKNNYTNKEPRISCLHPKLSIKSSLTNGANQLNTI